MKGAMGTLWYIHIPYQMRSDLELPRVFQAHTCNQQIHCKYGENLCLYMFAMYQGKMGDTVFLPDIVTETDLI